MFAIGHVKQVCLIRRKVRIKRNSHALVVMRLVDRIRPRMKHLRQIWWFVVAGEYGK